MPPTSPEPADSQDLALLASAGLAGCRVLRRTSKSLLAVGQLDGMPVIVKILTATDEFWAARFRHEIEVCQRFCEHPPPVTAPRLIRTNGSTMLILERLDGRPLDPGRYLPYRLDETAVAAVLQTTRRLNGWQPPAAAFGQVLDYRERVVRYHDHGFLPGEDRDALLRLLARAGARREFCHGDLTPANILLSDDRACALVDWEFSGWYLPGYDLAVLYVLLGASTPALRDRIDELVAASAAEVPFCVNLARVLSRELRLHRELSPDNPDRAARLPVIEAAWLKTRRRIQAADHS